VPAGGDDGSVPAGVTERRSPERIAVDVAIRLALLGLFVYLAFALIQPFLPITIWAVILTVALYPVFGWLRALLGGNGVIAAILLTMANLAITFGPASILTASLAASLERLVFDIKSGKLSLSSLPESVTTLPFVGDLLHEASSLASESITGVLKDYGERLLAPGAWLLVEAAAIAESFLVFAASLVVAGFLFVSGPRLVGKVRGAALRLVGPRGSAFVDLAGDTIRNVARGVIGIAVLQSLLIGVGLIVAGVPHAGLLTLAALVLAIVQVGTVPVMAPLVIWYWLTREPSSAVLFTLYMGPAATIDSILKPLAMGQGLQTPMLVIIVGVLGGTVAYGLPGLFLGPIIMALLYEIVGYWLQSETPTPETDATGSEEAGS